MDPLFHADKLLKSLIPEASGLLALPRSARVDLFLIHATGSGDAVATRSPRHTFHRTYNL